MTFQIMLFGAESAQPEYEQWSVRSFDDGAVAYRLDQPADLNAGSIQSALDALEDLLASGGVAIAIVQRSTGEAVLKTLVGKKLRDGNSPHAAARITFAGGHDWLPLERSSETRLAKWDAIIVPVSHKAEKALKNFMSAARDLPPSTRAAVLFQLALPTLESRVSRLEQLDAYTAKLAQADVPALKARQQQLTRLVVGTVIVLIVFGVAASITFSRLRTVEERLVSSTAPEATGVITGAALDAPLEGPQVASHQLPDKTVLEVQKGSVEDRLIDALVRRDTGESFSLTDLRIEGGSVVDTGASGAQLVTVAKALVAFGATVEVSGGEVDFGGEETPQQRASLIRAALARKSVPSARVRISKSQKEAAAEQAGDQNLYPAVRIVSYTK